MKIGVFGSSFNPPHIGHLVIAEEARIKLGLDKVLFVPTANPYHKKVDLLDYSQRYEMTRVSIEDNKYFEISDIEKNIEGSSYSYEVVKALRNKEDGDYYFIIGSDSFLDIEKWYRYEDFLNLINLVVFKRPGYDISKTYFKNIKAMTSKEIFYFDHSQIEVSSSYIRQSIKSGHIPKYLLYYKTYEYILENETW